MRFYKSIILQIINLLEITIYKKKNQSKKKYLEN